MSLRPTRAVIDLDALARNFHALKRSLPAGCLPMPVVKADGYGHGAAPVARRLEREGASILAVAVVEEGIELRRAGITLPILVMGWIGPDQLEPLVAHGLTPNAHSIPQLEEIAAFAERRSTPLALHLKMDTGMTRLGLRREDLGDALAVLGAHPRLVVEGVFQNFASADAPASRQNETQARAFDSALAAIRQAGHRPSAIHMDNSAATLTRSQGNAGITHVRPGLALFARVPGIVSAVNARLEDVMSFVSVVDQVKTVPAGTRVGYGGTFEASRETTLAIVPAGYADGVPRSLSGRGVVVVGGERCPIAGRISMDLTAVDVTGLKIPARRGDEVVFFGTRRGIRLGVEEAAEAAGTVAWELLCGVGPRVPRVIVENGSRILVQSKFLSENAACSSST